MIKKILITIYIDIRTFVISHIIKHLSQLLIKIGIIEKFVLVRIDGGICSQMHFYMISQLFRNKGYMVKYDLTWFEKNGYDMLGKHRRVFDLQKAFPYIGIRIASKFEILLYQPYSYINDYYDDVNKFEWQGKTPPIYLKGYYKTNHGWYIQYFALFKIEYSVLNLRNYAMLKEIEKCNNSVAVHVRRGDLAVFHNAYGNPVPYTYFVKAIKYIETRIGSPYLFFFSDDPQWVKVSLVNQMGLKDNYCIIDFNDSTKGYMDMLLIAACKHQITSKGSLGKYGAFLNKTGENIVTLYDDEYERSNWEGEHPNFVFIKS